MTNDRKAAELIIVFSKLPVRGKVKTRLEGALGLDACRELHRAAMLDAVDVAVATAEARDAEAVLCLAPEGASDVRVADIIPEPGLSIRVQEGADLGQRLASAFEQGFGQGFGRIAVLGADIPALGRSEIDLAMDGLRSFKGVIGPALDGGYYLIGLSSPWPALFDNVDWGTSTVFEDTMRQAGDMRHRLRVLHPLRDLDTPRDLSALRVALKDKTRSGQRLCGPRLRRLLTEWDHGGFPAG